MDQLTLPGQEQWIPTEEQVAKARRVLLSGEMTGEQLADVYGINSGELSRYVGGSESVDPNSPPAIEYDRAEDGYIRKEVAGDGVREDVRKIRQRALDGERATEIAEDYDCSVKTIRDRLRGDSYASVDSPGPLEFDTGKQQYVRRTGDQDGSDRGLLYGYELTEGEWAGTVAEVAAARRILLEGKTTGSELASELNITKGELSHYVRGKTGPDPDDPPAIEYDHGASEYIPKGGDESKSGDGSDGESHAEPKTGGAENAAQLTPTPSHGDRDGGASKKRGVVIACLAFVVGYLLRSLLGESE